MLRIFLAKLRALLTSDTSDPTFGDEMQTHLGLLAQRFEHQGMSPREAAAAACRQFGNSTLLQQRHREMRIFLSLSNLGRDLRFALRQLRKSPGFTLTAVLTLALSIGAATAIFSIVDGILLKPLAYHDSGQLVVVWERVRFLQKLFPYVGANPRHAQMWVSRSTDFSGLTLLGPSAAGVSLDNGHPRFVGRFIAYPNLLDVLGIQPALGRNFFPQEAMPGHDNVAIITWSLWQNLFQGDASALGKSISLNGVPTTVIGVLPQSAYLPRVNELSPIPRAIELPPTEIITPLHFVLSDVSWNGDYGNYVTLGRLKPSVTVAHATSQLDTIARDIARQIPPNERGDDEDVSTSLSTYIQPLKEAIVGKSTRILWLLFAAILSVLLIACVNLANAQLARSIARDRESAVRCALGASAGSLLQSSLAEVVLLSLTGGVLGIALAYVTVHRVAGYAHLALARTEDVAVSPTVLVLTILLTVGATLLFGLLPFLRLLRIKPLQALQGLGRSTGSRRNNHLRRWLIGLQVFACTALLLVTGLFAKSLVTLLASDKGFSPEHVVIAEVDLDGATFPSARRASFDDAVLDRLRALPGVQSAGLVNAMLLNGESHIDGVGRPNALQVLANYRSISPGYFSTLQERLLEGRELNDGDRTRKSAVISETTAKAIYPNEDALGRQINHSGTLYTVVGIAADAHNTSLRAAAPVNMVYLGYWERPSSARFLLVRSSQNTTVLAEEVRKSIWNYDPTVTIASIHPLDSQISDVLSPERLETTILCTFGGSALLLALLGIYGTLSYSVETRKQEIGIRMALGATRRNVYLGTLREIILPIAAGLSLGWLASLGIGRSVASLLYGTAPTDAIVAIAVLCIFMLAATAATFLPCRKATRIDPMEALRAE